MTGKFTATVQHFKDVSDKRLSAIQKESTQRLIDTVQTPVAKGGLMRVDTGFLRASGQASLSGLPSGPARGDANGNYNFDANSTTVALADAKPGQTIWFGWTANYAKAREWKDGFLRTGVLQWQSIVDGVLREVKQRIK